VKEKLLSRKFQLTLATILTNLALVLQGKLDMQTGVVVSAVSVGLYVLTNAGIRMAQVKTSASRLEAVVAQIQEAITQSTEGGGEE